ncbi:MAG: D-alanine--D-alanine ligase [Chloroflexi bacterium]|jgi:D-alanine-D-alanine ligase|nr:D-alanine--D-alanine ligase [Chloroflexota bacterium]MBT3669662.1 D-alanine--D-alanine ligase [Chloroflexota bacterium]MBT4004077.1 D-alanine--D-alanine ligase [Chloroflexota bacterium]MBT4305087.1 D-alanine--D-alanine ligase [Chloroflexota bacterium]MBT4533392.1 D-alanine--D-alanine ligase [Chloroflexota bacterium]
MSKLKIRILVLFGGRSGEHAVSLMSAKFVLGQLDPERYEVTKIGITRHGDWFVGDHVLDDLIEEEFSKLSAVTIFPNPSRPGLHQIDDDHRLNFVTDFDVVFPVLHGTFGEDGTLQGLLEMADVAYVGPGVVGSAVGMDKAIFADVMTANDIPIVKTVLVLRSEIESDPVNVVKRMEEALGEYPYFVKPANLGSSVGISKSKNSSDLIEGLMDAAQYDRRIVVQKGHEVREIEVSIMGNDQPLASVCGEVLPAEEFYSYEAKYHDDSSRTVIPADISEELSDRIRVLAIKAYKACDLAGLTRVDFFIDKDNDEIYINELNTIPGFTQISMYPLLWEASGVGNEELVDRLVMFALERKAERDATKRTFRRNE